MLNLDIFSLFETIGDTQSYHILNLDIFSLFENWSYWWHWILWLWY